MMQYILQMGGSVSTLQWEYETTMHSDEMAIQWAGKALEYCPAAQQAHTVSLFNKDTGKAIAYWSFAPVKPVFHLV